MSEHSDAEFGRLTRAMLKYSITGEPMALSGNERFYAKRVMAEVDEFQKRSAEISAARREAGKKGMEHRWHNKNNKVIASYSNDNKESSPLFPPSPFPPIPPNPTTPYSPPQESSTFSDEKVRCTDVQRVVEAWNSLGLKSVQKVADGTQRAQWLHKRLKDYGLDSVLLAIENVRQSPFLNGDNKRGWEVTFDWFLRPNNFPKVLDGNYNAGGGKSAYDREL